MKKKVWIPAACVLAAVIATGGAYANHVVNAAPSFSLEEMPNYTQIRGDINTAAGIDYSKQPMMGDENAKVQVVEFGDFKCPACMIWETQGNYDEFKKNYIDTGKVKFYWMNFAFIDRDSIQAASAGEAIYQQSPEAFWEYKHKMYENQGDETKIWATRDYLKNFVRQNIVGIDYEKFDADLDAGTYALNAKEDYKVGETIGINGTPKFVVNGKVLPSSSYEELAAAIDAALAQ